EVPHLAVGHVRTRCAPIVLGRPGIQLVWGPVMTRWLATAEFRGLRGRGAFRASYEHPWPIRLAHWLAAVSLIVMTGSGVQILRAFPAFGPKLPEHDIVNIPRALALGGWLAGGLRWHLTFMWIFAGAGLIYVLSQAMTRRYAMVLF